MGVICLVFGTFWILNAFCKEAIQSFQQSLCKPSPTWKGGLQGSWRWGCPRLPLLVSLLGGCYSSFPHTGARGGACSCRGLGVAVSPCPSPPLGPQESGKERPQTQQLRYVFACKFGRIGAQTTQPGASRCRGSRNRVSGSFFPPPHWGLARLPQEVSRNPIIDKQDRESAPGPWKGKEGISYALEGDLILFWRTTVGNR